MLPLYLLSDLSPSPLLKVNVQYIQTVCSCKGGGGGSEVCVVDHRVHRVAIAAYWSTFSDEGKISPEVEFTKKKNP
jgi:hypothetical protein